MATAQNIDTVDLQGLRHYPSDWRTFYEVSLSDLYPEKAAQIRRNLKNIRQDGLARIAAAERIGDHATANGIKQETRTKIDRRKAEIKRQYPKTTIVMYGKVVKSDMEDALYRLRSGRMLMGQNVHVYLQGNSLYTSDKVPTEYEGPSGRISGDHNRSSKPQRVVITPRKKKTPGPSFDGLNRRPNTSQPTSSARGLPPILGNGVYNGATSLFGM